MDKVRVSAAIDQARRNRAEILDGFKALLAFPSISQDAACQDQLEACAEWIVAQMRRIGLENCRALPTAGHPIVYADWLHAGGDKPTILIYAHYDVQPVGDEALWRTAPFEPTVVDGRLVARGTVDDKCGIWVNLAAIEAIMRAAGNLPLNIKLFFEGEEELGSRNTGSFVAESKALLAADALIICDGPFSPRQPVVGIAVRGAISGEVRVKGPQHDLHSGRYGGAVQNPIHVLASIIDSFHDADGRARIAGFYDGIQPLSEDARRDLEKLWQTIGPPLEAGAGINAFWGDAMGSFAERATALPTLDVGGIFGGYAGEGNRAIIPAEAGFKVTIRTVAGQDSELIWKRFCQHLRDFETPSVDIDVTLLGIAHPFLMAEDGREARALQSALRAALGVEAMLMRHGGSLPIGGLLQRELDLPVTMFGFGAGDHSHAPNEYIVVEDFYLAIEVAIHLLYALAAED